MFTRLTSGPISSLMAMLLLAALQTGALSPAIAGNFDKGMTAYGAGDYATALAEWRPLAEQGDAAAQHNLGVMYDEGKGVPQDDAEAVKWYRRAAEQGLADAQYNLGQMYRKGTGVPQDHVTAHMWLNLAAALGSRDAVKNRELVTSRLSSDALMKAQALARQCLASNYQDCGD